MGNEITSQYFNYSQKADDKFLKSVREKVDFTANKEIFRGQIYDKDKVGSLIYFGMFNNEPAVLKIQILEPTIDEIDIINGFNEQNKSKMIRVPDLYAGSRWNKNDGYGYLLLEYVVGKPIYGPSLANEREIKKFCEFYQEYKTKTITKPLLKQKNKEDSLELTTRRVNGWVEIAKAQKYLTKTTEDYLERYFSIIDKHLLGEKTQFMHGHLMRNDIHEVSAYKYVLMSNLFWSYRPEHYDTTFNIWADIKSISSLKITEEDVIDFVEKWQSQYRKLDAIKKDKDFKRKFMLMMLERCIGALLVDLENQNYKKNRKAHIRHLTRIFSRLFDYCALNINYLSTQF